VASALIDVVLSPVVVGLAALGAWISAAILVHAARNATPRSGALTERAILAVVIAVFLTTYLLIAYNTDNGRILFDQDAARRLLRTIVLMVGVIPIIWTVLWLTGRLGEGE
jgi:hypothetical protein